MEKGLKGHLYKVFFIYIALKKEKHEGETGGIMEK